MELFDVDVRSTWIADLAPVTITQCLRSNGSDGIMSEANGLCVVRAAACCLGIGHFFGFASLMVSHVVRRLAK